MSSQSENPQVIEPNDVAFVPSRFFPQLGDDLTIATATTLVNEFCDCPECGESLSVDTADGVQSDRDVIWTDEETASPIRRQIDRSNAHECDLCGTRLRILVEEKARPAQWSQIPDEPWVDDHLWIQLDDGSYAVLNPAAIHISAEPNQ